MKNNISIIILLRCNLSCGEEEFGFRKSGRRIKVIPSGHNMARIKFQSYTIIRCALEIIVDLFYMGT